MPPRDRLTALLVALCWGVNFPAIHLTLEQFPPFLAGSLRFAVLAVPAVLLVPRPQVPLRWLLGYGLGFGTLQFAFLYLAMDGGMPTGLASLVLQSSAPFTVVLGALLLRERVTRRQAVGIAVAVLGLTGIAVLRAGAHGAGGLVPVLLTLCGGLGWALGNLASRRAQAPDPVRFTLWMSTVPVLPLLALALVVDGRDAVVRSFTTLGTATGAWALAGLAFTVLVATLLGTGRWTALMARHPSSVVAPWSLLVPVVGIGTSWWWFGERPAGGELALAALVVGGVLLGSTARPAPPPQPVPPSLSAAPSRDAARSQPAVAVPAGATGTTRAVAIPATPSPLPVRPRPSVVVAETETGAPTAADSAASASARRGPSRGRLPTTCTTTLPTA
ncbi:hypothetical protein Cma02nite_03220 [Cellulomonas marina]|uniref:O-acetylserine/cysteine efflux transporter n=1 Tax=Cellulomonas marina TaxID=988821 RepID=A0A1I0WMV6_9CELL|nr:hypothetical protein Cma02nite_03220 [Cellulomonas marina]SFA89333.1 O-acetylserine/cysteine efflux transporter [Cellulomonas marina]